MYLDMAATLLYYKLYVDTSELISSKARRIILLIVTLSTQYVYIRIQPLVKLAQLSLSLKQLQSENDHASEDNYSSGNRIDHPNSGRAFIIHNSYRFL
jgi:hypothetical protein